MEPNRCWTTGESCVIKAEQSRISLATARLTLELARGATLYKSGPNEVGLMRGMVSVKLNGEGSLGALYAKVSGMGEAIVERKSDAVTVYALSGVIQIQPLGDPRNLDLPAGYMMTVGEVTDRGQSMVNVPMAFSPSIVLKKWSILSSLPRTELMDRAKSLLPEWIEAVERASQLQRDLAERYMASVAREARERAEFKRKMEEENRRLRALFRRLNYLDESHLGPGVDQADRTGP